MLGTDPHQASQRAKVGMIGLGVVVGLIALASAMLGFVTRDRPIAAAGAARPETVANLSLANTTDAEPLAELGVAPAVRNQSAVQQ